MDGDSYFEDVSPFEDELARMLKGGTDWVAETPDVGVGEASGVMTLGGDDVGRRTCTDGELSVGGPLLDDAAEVAGVAGDFKFDKAVLGFEPLLVAHTFIRATFTTMRNQGVPEERLPSMLSGAARCTQCQRKATSWVCIKQPSSSRMRKCQECSRKKISCSLCEPNEFC